MLHSVDSRARNVVAVVLGGGRGTRLHPLTADRAKPAVPIAGKYRLIDVPISNAIHSGMERILVLTQFNSTSLHRHIALTYKFDPFSRGYVQILAAQQTPDNERWFQGTADAVRQNLSVIREAEGDSVLILSGDHMYRMDYRNMLRDHLENEADVTIAVLPCSHEEIGRFGAVRVDSTGRVVEFREKPATVAAREGMEVDPALRERHWIDADRPFLASMGIYLFSKAALEQALASGWHDFGGDILPRCTETHRVQASFFDGYWKDIGTIRSFYDTHMELLRSPPPFDFNDPDWPVYTRPRYLPPSRLDACRANRTMLAEGTILSDATIEDAVIGVGTTARGVTIRRSLVLGADPNLLYRDRREGAPSIGEGTVIEGAIVDRNARIGRNCRIRNRDGREASDGPGWVIRDGVVVVRRGATIADDTVI